MKILLVIPYYAPSWTYGGPVVYCYEISRALAARGHEVAVYATDTLDKENRVATDPSDYLPVTVKYFRNVSNWLAFNHHLYIAPALIAAARQHVSEFDIIHLIEYRTFQNPVVQHYARIFHVPYVLKACGSLEKRLTKKALKTVYDYVWGYSLLKHASKVIALTRREADQAQKMGVDGKNIQLIPSGVNFAEFENLPAKGAFRARFGIPDQDFLLLFVGRVHVIKGLDLLAQALARLEPVDNHLRLAVVGPDDGYMPALKALVASLGLADRVTITGPLYGTAKIQAYVDADIFVLPSRSEGFPLTVLEACAAGTPVVITDACNISDIIDGRAGLVAPVSAAGLAAAIEKMLSDSRLRATLGRQARQLAADNFDYKLIAGRLEQLYSACLRPDRLRRHGLP